MPIFWDEQTQRLACPQCKTGTLSLINDGLVSSYWVRAMAIRGEQPELRLVPRPFYACNECEFCVEVKR